ncbi:hypothetical protein ACEN2T_17765 [Pseudomonas sp. W22_MBD1_FP4]|uniref:hypothetical protein n=1 Tax=Pseudomonas sp. W22_MBD1_FP4 TaxID=3240272 RepID=UPI003F9DA434
MMLNERNEKFFSAISSETKTAILAVIADRYGITPEEAYEQVTDKEAECLLDYLGEPYRSATSVLMQRHGIRK